MMAVAEAKLDALLDGLAERGVPMRAVIGNIETADSPGRITVV